MKLALAAVFSLAIPMMPMTAHADAATSVRHATQMCNWLDSTKLFKGKCGVNQGGKSVNVAMETNKTEAGKICTTITGKMKGDGVSFDRGWKLQIGDSRRGNAKLADCSL